MTSYEVALLWGSVILALSTLLFFTAVTSRRPVAMPALLFVVGGFVMYYAITLSGGQFSISDLPDAAIKFFSRIF